METNPPIAVKVRAKLHVEVEEEYVRVLLVIGSLLLNHSYRIKIIVILTRISGLGEIEMLKVVGD